MDKERNCCLRLLQIKNPPLYPARQTPSPRHQKRMISPNRKIILNKPVCDNQDRPIFREILCGF